MFQLVALVNYSQKPCLKTDTMNNRRHDSLITSGLSVEITTKCAIRALINFVHIISKKERIKHDRSS